MNIKHRVHRIRYTGWNTMDDDVELYADEFMSDATRWRRKHSHETDVSDSGERTTGRPEPRPDKESVR